MESERKYLAVWLWHEKAAGMSGISAILNNDKPEDDACVWKEVCLSCNLNMSLEEAASRGMDIYGAYAARGVKLVLATDEDYPKQLRAISHRIPVLSVIGDVALLNRRQVAMVGSRKTNEAGERFGAVIAQILMSRGFTITSGGALGIDAVAHREAMRQNLPTIVVTATNVERVYPLQNRDIFEYACRYGAVVSQFPRSTEPLRELFPSRNTIIAGLSEATCIVHCREGSGALYTAEAARRLARPVYVAAMPGFSSLSEGGLALVKAGKANLVSCAADFDPLGHGDGETRGIVHNLGLKPLLTAIPEDSAETSDAPNKQIKSQNGAARKKRLKSVNEPPQTRVAPPMLNDELQSKIYELLGTEPVGRDYLASSLKCSDLSLLTEKLIEMEFAGVISCIAGRYKRL